MAAFTRTAVIALQCIFVTAVLAIAYGFLRRGFFTLAYVFNASFLAGAVILFIGMLIFLLPAGLVFNRLTGKLTGFKTDKLTDHSTFMERYAEQHNEKQKRAFEILALGLSVIVITGVIQLALSVMLHA